MANLQNDLLLRTIRGERTERPPVWLMRQAGRILPQYRALRAGLSGFKELVETPHLAAEVTVQPVDELDVDAAIIFSDILVIPEAMGLPYKMIPGKGPIFRKTIKTGADIEPLRAGEDAAAYLPYVYEAVKQTNRLLDNRIPLIGFSGAPWTLLAYMVEGSGSKTFSQAKRFLYKQPAEAHRLLEKLTTTIIAYLKAKVSAGVHVVQLFDSWAGILSPEQYRTFSLPYLTEICRAVNTVPVTVFAKNAWFCMAELGRLQAQTIGLDWNTDPEWARTQLPQETVLQGNLDPCMLYAPAATVEAATCTMIERFGMSRHIVNLGHGVYPDTPLPNVKTFVNTVKNYRYP